MANTDSLTAVASAMHQADTLTQTTDSARQAADIIQQADSLGKQAIEGMADVLTGQGTDRLADLLGYLFHWGLSAGTSLVSALVVFTIGWFLIKGVLRVVRHVLNHRTVDGGVKSFVLSFLSIVLKLLLFIAVINKLGVETTSFTAIMASFGLAIGMAMSGNLSNFVGGMLILLFKPYRVGDWIEVDGTQGTVDSIEMFHTIIKGFDGSYVYLSNSSMSSAKIKNYSREDTLRLSFTVAVEYGQDLKQVEQTLLTLAREDKRILQDPKPYVALDQLAESSVNMVLRLWVRKEDYWNCLYDMNRQIYDRFNAAGINFPFPQLTIHQG